MNNNEVRALIISWPFSLRVSNDLPLLEMKLKLSV